MLQYDRRLSAERLLLQVLEVLFGFLLHELGLSISQAHVLDIGSLRCVLVKDSNTDVQLTHTSLTTRGGQESALVLLPLLFFFSVFSILLRYIDIL